MARLSLTRTGSESYRDYLRSPAWGFRRVRWFRDARARGAEPACPVCQLTLDEAGSLDLHHLRYDGVHRDPVTGAWKAREKDEDLMPMCRAHHEQLHASLDARKEYLGWDRRRATVLIVVRMIRRHRKKTHDHQ
ncbi:hypothetical protein [Citricoccus sp.]|uniref:hypothetical protein n=1 Tax=Citricoccus sp. TaxID=1978372 RepID=UPI002637058C|nr:hypothetical protein [Citricoccus sp.]HRO31608.1 hypothetical protein [Citricoccus sp.]HRO95394.1 hypothetical protein [Citricoccus sp.]